MGLKEKNQESAGGESHEIAMLRKKYRKLKDIKEEADEEEDEINKKQVHTKDEEESKIMYNNDDDSMASPSDMSKNGPYLNNSSIHRQANLNDTSRFNDSRYSSSGGQYATKNYVRSIDGIITTESSLQYVHTTKGRAQQKTKE